MKLNPILLCLQGFLLSDWAAITDFFGSVFNGTDMNMPGFRAYGNSDQANPAAATNSWWGKNLVDAVTNGTVPEARLDDMVTRIMASYYKLDQTNLPKVNFDYLTEDTYYQGQLVNEHVNVQGDHGKLIREIGAAGTILLKNTNHALPLNAQKIKSLAVFGSDAGPNPEGPNSCGDRGCDSGTLVVGWGSGSTFISLFSFEFMYTIRFTDWASTSYRWFLAATNFPYLIDPLAAIQEYVHDQSPTTEINYVLDDYNYNSVTGTAKQADTCLVFGSSGVFFCFTSPVLLKLIS